MFSKKLVSTAALASTLSGLALLAGGANHGAPEPPQAYPTRCVLVTLPPDGRPLPKVCVVYPL